ILKDGKIPVKSIKYKEEEIGVYLDITHKYPKSDKRVILKNIKSVRIDVYKNKDNIFKYLGVPYHWFSLKGKKLLLNNEKYALGLKSKQIDCGDYKFQFSLYKNDLFTIEKQGQIFEYVFRGDNNPRQNKIEANYVHRNRNSKEKRVILTIGPSINNITKFYVDVLGNRFKVEKEKFVNYLQK
ncbi:hypothetical protein D7X33_45095, partial [Butyricicoccus sp. 1XD8-22]